MKTLRFVFFSVLFIVDTFVVSPIRIPLNCLIGMMGLKEFSVKGYFVGVLIGLKHKPTIYLALAKRQQEKAMEEILEITTEIWDYNMQNYLTIPVEKDSAFMH